jgi:hypothetical protein
MEVKRSSRIIGSFIDPFNLNEIVDKDNFSKHFSVVLDICDPKDAFNGVTEDPIPVDFSGLPDGRFISVMAGASIPKHLDKVPVFRLILAGEAIVNDKFYKAGDWMVIPHNYSYEIKTSKGYTAFLNSGVC